MTTELRSKSYYDHFSEVYERRRHEGYHVLIDELEVRVAEPYCGGRVLEAGCGTGLILKRLAPGAQQAVGIDLSSGMLSGARRRGLSVLQGSVEHLPFPDEHFDAVVSFKVLAHVPNIRGALAEFARVTRPGGHLVLEFYNRRSLRHLIKRVKRPTRVGSAYTDDDVFTRYDTIEEIKAYLPRGIHLHAVRGVRVVTPVSHVHDLPVVRSVFAAAERLASDAPVLRGLGGFLIVVLRKE
ncbi:MAG: class I SAM-dependent methyltransferase [Deltaproteobacteria bacterium]|nr:class I SAM-dependent methyltransferase [Deltaproteobacteria bacterium]